jgi:hypothetical protein
LKIEVLLFEIIPTHTKSSTPIASAIMVAVEMARVQTGIV